MVTFVVLVAVLAAGYLGWKKYGATITAKLAAFLKG